MIKNNIASALNLLNNNKKVVIAMLIMFLIGIAIGFVLPPKFKLIMFKSITHKVEGIVTDSNFLTFFKIFLNNSFVGLLLIVLGFTLVLPILIILFNGIGLGVVVDLYLRIAQLKPIALITSAGALLPHGIIELFALITCSIFGITLGLKLFFKKKVMAKRSLKSLFAEIMKIYFFILLPLLLLAAFIESFITPSIGGGISNILSETSYDKILGNAVLSDKDFLDFGILVKEVPISDYARKSPSIRQQNYLNLISILFYDDEIYEKYKNWKNNPSLTKVYMDENSNFAVVIQISRFKSVEDANQGLILLKKIIEIAANGDNLKVNNLGDHLFKLEYGNNPIHQKLGSTGTFAYSIRFMGDKTYLISSVIAKQETKLKKCKA
ncbi:MAG: stage II sporulation protein M [Nanoarchaeota archaeon]